ncbi:hypothetical protein JHU04_002597 [Brenneria sp. 4F2]|nr:hypothetical protein [Brenneria bubanii]
MIYTHSNNHFFSQGITSLFRKTEFQILENTIFIDMSSNDLKCGWLYDAYSRFLRIIFVDEAIFHIAKRLCYGGRTLVIHKKTPLNDIVIRLETFLNNQRRRGTGSATEKSPITVREQQVLAHLFSGKTAHYCADRLGINIKTVSQHKRSAIKKLGLKNTGELYIYNKSIKLLLKDSGLYR